MRKADLKELHYITHIDNLVSVFDNGILCFDKVKKIAHTSIADSKVQKRRAKVIVDPATKKSLHSYANLYFNARNPMMFVSVQNDKHKELMVVQVDLSILDEPKVVISDHNASSDYARFLPSTQDGLTMLNSDRIFAKYWTDPNPIVKFQKQSEICAEVLVPDCIPAGFIKGIYVSCDESLKKVKSLLTDSPFANKISINSDLFFQ